MICGKVVYQSRQEAMDAVIGMNTDNRINRSAQQPGKCYFCSNCGGWHLFTEGKSKKHKNNKRRKTAALWKRSPMVFRELTIHNRLKIK